ncbi:MAG: 4Fe-4S dicluster domain-containing protein, partial [Candidatus Omnitrophica bacterium]|nr:4Fe-4S dicluster domain-containing protein [Candidatus Omnitrophota bacterium]
MYTITKKDLYDLFLRLSEKNRVVVPYRKGDMYTFGDFDMKKESDIELGGIRQSEPIKSFINHPREKVADPGGASGKNLIIAGVKGCDLSSLSLQDFVFLKNPPEDPLYSENRKNTTIIGVDCTLAKETCFCLAMEGVPYPRANFDICLTSFDDYFLVEIATEKGKAIIMEYKLFFKDAFPGDVKRRESTRESIGKKVRSHIEKRATPDTSRIKGKVKEHYNLTALWQDVSSTCVECGACNLVCPTCHCFLLFDDKPKTGGNRRYRTWDACLYKSFARVAGGANPRKHLYERMRNRFDKKFSYFPEVMNYFSCTGCGRWIDACIGDIDIREVLKGLASGETWNKLPHE